MQRTEQRYQLGPLDCVLRIDGGPCEGLRQHYAGFEAPSTHENPWIVDAREIQAHSSAPPTLPRVELVADGSIVLTDEATYRTRIAPKERRVRIDYQRWSGPETLGPEPRCLHNALKVAVANILALECGFLLHASAGIIGGSGIAFLGPSGAGKTTIARTLPRETLLNDEMVAVEVRSDGAWLHSTPFSGELEVPLATRSARWRVGALLEKATVTRAEHVGWERAARALLECIVVTEGLHELERRAFARAFDVVRGVKWVALSFDRGAHGAATVALERATEAHA